MKRRLISFSVVLVLFVVILYTQKHFGRVVMHEALSAQAERPDMFLKSAGEFAENHRYDRTSYHIELAIKAIRKIENDLDLVSINLVESGVNKLETIHNQLLKDSLVTDEMFIAFGYSLNTLAAAELRASEVYFEKDQEDLAKLALNHAKMHLKNAMLYEDFMSNKDTMYLQIEKHVFMEIDSLIESKTTSPAAVIERINQIISEMDEIIAETRMIH